MSQLSFSDAEFAGKRKVTRREKFLAQMERAVPWKVSADLVGPHYPKAGNGRRPYPLEVVLRIHFMQQWFNLSDPAMEEALYDSTSIRNFAKLSLTRGSIPASPLPPLTNRWFQIAHPKSEMYKRRQK